MERNELGPQTRLGPKVLRDRLKHLRLSLLIGFVNNVTNTELTLFSDTFVLFFYDADEIHHKTTKQELKPPDNTPSCEEPYDTQGKEKFS